MTRPLLAGLVLALAGCGSEPAPIDYGRDECAYCRMTISDDRYGAALLTRQGKTYKFDSVECLAAFSAEARVPADKVHSLWVTDYARPRALVDARQALYLRSPALQSPMGMNLAAFARRADLDVVRARGGEEMSWDQVLTVVRESGFLGRYRAHLSGERAMTR